MVKFLKEHWFGFILSFLVFVFLIFSIVITVAPHNDAKMRGFTPCTYQMAQDINQTEDIKFMDVLVIVSSGYGCYFAVIKDGIKDYFSGKQPTPWANYLFVPESTEIPADGIEDEPFSEDLIKAKMFDSDEIFDDTEEQEKDDE